MKLSDIIDEVMDSLIGSNPVEIDLPRPLAFTIAILIMFLSCYLGVLAGSYSRNIFLIF